MTADPQVSASHPTTSVFVTANAGSGKTSTLVKRVARLLLGGAPPEAILCVTYTKAAAAEMQRRLFDMLGDWAVTGDAALAKILEDLDERRDDLPKARALFARALETPGGLKIQTIHAFCEKLLRRFPLEAGVSPGFRVLESAAAAEVSAQARDDVARLAAEPAAAGPLHHATRGGGGGSAPAYPALAQAYAHFSVELDWKSFNDMFQTFEAKRTALAAYVDRCERGEAVDVWTRCGFAGPIEPDAAEAESLAAVDWTTWRRAAQALLTTNGVTDRKRAEAMLAAADAQTLSAAWGALSTAKGEPVVRLATQAVEPWAKDWLIQIQGQLQAANERLKAARLARDTDHALVLARAYAALYEQAKAAQGGLDFGDLIERTRQLLVERTDAAWVLYKLDGGIDHVLLDEAQDTAPEQWNILHALTEEFFAGAGPSRRAGPDIRTVFAVGDEKQSIYSFQGAAPERFLAEADAFRAVVEAAGRDFRRTPLLESWRSAPEVLEFVDAVFADPAAAAGLQPAQDQAEPIVHIARRDPEFGSVELWPLEESEPDEEVDPWAPVDTEPKLSANKQLALRIARFIKDAVTRREAVIDKYTREPRPVGYGDFLILVRRRKALFHEIIRALKREGVAVGGADRMKLSEHVVFLDLLALGRFAQFPDDDLTLAALLRSPFCDIDEQSLYDLAQPREGRSLWSELRRRAGERTEWTAAAAFFEWVRAQAIRRPPFDFYSRVLSRLDAAGRSMRARMLSRLGREAEDALDAFLGEALAAEQRRTYSLERFIAQAALNDLEVSREQEDASGRDGGEVRVMTAHGAKGLEAPIVLLPDTTTRARAMGGPLLETQDGGFLWAPRKADDCPASEEARERRDLASEHESLRLLYVALTRARDRLVICGVKTKDQFYNGSWCDIAARAFDRPGLQGRVRTVEIDGAQIIRFGADPQVAPPAVAPRSSAATLPDWARGFAPAEPPARRYASPSTLAESERGPSASPLAEREGMGRYRRGTIIHRLLQLLPDLPAAARPETARAMLAREPDLTAAQREEMAAAALGVLNDPQFAAVFGPGSRAEAAVAGSARDLPAGLAVSGRVDRLVVEPGRVLVVDFKTNRPAPAAIEDADRAYLAQMAVYVAVLCEVFPGRQVEAALVWTDGPKLMAVPENIVARTLAQLAGAG